MAHCSRKEGQKASLLIIYPAALLVMKREREAERSLEVGSLPQSLSSEKLSLTKLETTLVMCMENLYI